MKTNKVLVLLMALIMVLTMVPAMAETNATPASTWTVANQKGIAAHVCVYGDAVKCPDTNYLKADGTKAAVSTIAYAPTCKKDGAELYISYCEKKADGCGSVKYDLYTIPATGVHTWDVGNSSAWNVVPEGKYKTGYLFSYDEETTVADTYYSKAATATENGQKVEWRECTGCGRVEIWLTTLYSPSYVDPTHKHNFVEKKLCDCPEHAKDQIAATCAKPGQEVYHMECNYVDPNSGVQCPAVQGHTTKSVPAGGHPTFDQILIAADYFKGEKMTNDKAEVIKEYISITAADAMTCDFTKATCKAGKLVVKCVDCKGELLNVAIDAGEHTYDEKTPINMVPATCTTAGMITYKCTVCGEEVTEIEEALDHLETPAFLQGGKVIKASADLKDCEPYYDIKYCGRMNTTNNEDGSFTVKKCEHYDIVGKEHAAKYNHADITKENYKTLNALGRVTIIKDTTGSTNCNIEKYVIVACKGCYTGSTSDDNYAVKFVIKEAGHDWKEIETGKVLKAATCTSEGSVLVQCKNYANCGATTTKTLDKLSHAVKYTVKQDQNCNTDGTVETWCNTCNTLLKTEIIPAGHVIPTATTKTNMVQNAKGEWVPEDCTQDGSVTGYCTRCKKAAQTNKYTKAAAHTAPENEKLITVSEATCQKIGTRTFTCTKCAMNVTEKIADFAPHFTKVDNVQILKDPTCLETGKKYEECATCPTGEEETREVEIAKVGHNYTKYVNGKIVCCVCGVAEDVVDYHNIKVITSNINMTSTSTSGNGKIEIPAAHAGKLYARINYGFKLDNGEAVAYVACVEVDEDGTFRMASPSAPYGATLTNVTVMITTAAQAQDMLIADVPNCGVTVLR